MISARRPCAAFDGDDAQETAEQAQESVVVPLNAALSLSAANEPGPLLHARVAYAEASAKI